MTRAKGKGQRAKEREKGKGERGPAETSSRRPPLARSAITAAIVVAALVAAFVWWRRAPAFAIAVDANRNVLLVTIDTLRGDALGSYGGKAATPNLDSLAAHGARFTFAHAHAVVTLTSHASMLTGQYPYEHGIRDNTGYRLAPNASTAATRLKQAGFATGAFIGGFPLDHRFGLGAGFTAYDDKLGQIGPSTDAGERERRADAVVAAALDWIGAQSGKWFAWIHVYDPHAPYAPPAPFASQFASDPYFGEVSFVDAALGPLFARLAGQARPTLVVVTGDHGESLGDHGELTHSTFAYESTLHVPLIVGQIEPGGRTAQTRGVTIDTPVRHVDLLPTMLEAVQAPPATPAVGASLVPLVAAGQGADRPSYFEAMSATLARGWAPLRGVLVGREKFIDLPITELYDLSADPAEARNLFASKPDRAQVLANTLKSFNVAPPGRPQAESTDTLERLRSLGYIGGGSGTVREQFSDADDPKRLIELEQIMIRAQDAFRAGRVDDAVTMYRSVIARRADMEDAYRRLALVFWRTGRPADAIATLEDALKHGVTQSEVKIKLGQYLAEAGQAARAIALLESFAGDDPDALIALGNAYQLAGRHADALRTFARLATLDPANGLALQNIGIAHLQARAFPQAEAALRQAIAVDATLGGAHTALGVVLAQTGRKPAAIDAWKRAVELDPGEVDALYNLTLNLAEAGRLDEARTYGRKFLAAAQGAPEADKAVIRRIVGS